MKQQFFRTSQIAQILGVYHKYPYRMMEDGRLPPPQFIGGLLGYTRETLEQILGHKIEDEEEQS